MCICTFFFWSFSDLVYLFRQGTRSIGKRVNTHLHSHLIALPPSSLPTDKRCSSMHIYTSTKFDILPPLLPRSLYTVSDAYGKKKREEKKRKNRITIRRSSLPQSGSSTTKKEKEWKKTVVDINGHRYYLPQLELCK